MKKQKLMSRSVPAKKEQEKSKDNPLPAILPFLRGLFRISSDTDRAGTVEEIVKGVEFRGTALWTLIFAILIASIGLNINSTAVVIGAMLISPLMGPIMGAGLAMGIYDFALMKKSLRNLAVMTLISIATSAIYFWVSPLSDAQSELLARTTPTLYDVLIAIAGGATGIIARSRKDKVSNVIPGVAIATALMPPLCTAGYGLATGSLRFFAGAFYLYMINSIFIGISTLVFVRYFKFKKVTYLQTDVEKRIHLYFYVFAVIFILPSVYMAYDIIAESRFKRDAGQYVSANFNFDNSKVISTNFIRRHGDDTVEITVIGDPISEEMVAHLKKAMANYNLSDAKLKIIYYGEKGKSEASRRELAAEEASIHDRDARIRYLESELLALKNKDRLVKLAGREVNILFPELESISFGDLLVQNVENLEASREVSVIVKWKRKPGRAVRKRLELFLKSRLELENLKVIESQ